MSDLQKINKELEKLQVSDDESVFSDSPSSPAPESCFGAKARDFQLSEEQQVSQRQQSGYREARSHSPAISLNSSAPSPSTRHRAKVRNGELNEIPVNYQNTTEQKTEKGKTYSSICILTWLYLELTPGISILTAEGMLF